VASLPLQGRPRLAPHLCGYQEITEIIPKEAAVILARRRSPEASLVAPRRCIQVPRKSGGIGGEETV